MWSLANKIKRCKHFIGQSERRESEVIKIWRNIADQTIFCLNIVYYPLIETKTYMIKGQEKRCMLTSVWNDGGDWRTGTSGNFRTCRKKMQHWSKSVCATDPLRTSAFEDCKEYNTLLHILPRTWEDYYLKTQSGLRE